MSRIGVLALFLVRDLFSSLAGLLPLAVAVAFGLIAFEYGMDQAQFFTVAGVGTMTLCFLTTMALAGRANRASSYLLVGRLRDRAELLAAISVGGIVVTAVLATLIGAGNLLADRVTLHWPSVAWLVPTWLALWLLAAALSVPLSTLTSRAGSHLAGYVVLVGLLVADDHKAWLASHRLEWLNAIVAKVYWPFSTLLSRASAGLHDRAYWAAMAVTLACAVVLFSLGAALFEKKDLLWAE